MIKIVKVLNNNAIVAEDIRKNTLVALGAGIAFRQKVGDWIADSKIEKTFFSEDEKTATSIIDAFSQVRAEYIELSDRVISEAETSSGKKLSDDIYVSLPDHLQFAVQRIKDGMQIQNRLTFETMQTYPDEFRIAQKAVEELSRMSGLKFPDDEATNIAMHIITAEEGDSLANTEETIKLINEIMQIIQEMLHELDNKSVAYYRLMTHLKFFIQRIKKGQRQNDKDFDRDLYEMVAQKYHAEYIVAQRIAGIIYGRYNYQVGDEEVMFLTIHIHRVNV
ncbi:PRD domain-containing protein [Lactobacillus delbrueckii subsp. indicus]|uniref:PRD domain-containing protein n=1 Tax=Lactobacillus delbrueckii TaxID=1584 RepID=UPI00222270B0|nr:PRD domain-containing protein [Lactobacillus delbrueckii]UYX12590.1 PRD domain-containing protein [Lactobacillus delbrueckii]UYY84405.1 PRD domain-containing protein [Lactobacillus delbrueckii subsp. indicus]